MDPFSVILSSNKHISSVLLIQVNILKIITDKIIVQVNAEATRARLCHMIVVTFLTDDCLLDWDYLNTHKRRV